MNVVSLSIVRNGTSYLDRFTAQLAALRDGLAAEGHAFRAIVVEGDSTDGTWYELHQYMTARGLVADLRQLHHGGRVFGSVESDERWCNASRVYNAALERLRATDDALFFVEADLIWDARTALALLGHLMELDGVAPLSMHRGGFFYDTWGYRKDGQRFSAQPPYHPALARGEMIEIDSAGSCLAVLGAYARAARFDPPAQANVSWCARLREAGARLWVDPALKVWHP